MPRPNMYIFAAMLIMAVMDIAIVSVSADPSANLTYLSRAKRQIFNINGVSPFGAPYGAGRVDTINDPTAVCAEQGVQYFCYEKACAKKCTAGGYGRNPFAAPSAAEPNPNVWCYTTKGNGGDENFVGCGSSQDCNPLWSCATVCGVQPSSGDNQLCQLFGCANGQCWASCNYPTTKYGRCLTGEGTRGGIKQCKTNSECKPKVNWKCETPCSPH